MKYIILLLLLVGCTSHTKYGDCVGINGEKDQRLKYEYSVKNIILGVVFFQVIAPPVIVLFNELECPVGTK